MSQLRQIISGGQSGVDRAALDYALRHDIPCGGWCPRGRLAEDGPLDSRYPLRETPSDGYAQRTRWNVRDSDATLIITRGKPCGGTALTIDFAEGLEKPHLVVDLEGDVNEKEIIEWIQREKIAILNVAGPRESKQPGIYTASLTLLSSVISN